MKKNILLLIVLFCAQAVSIYGQTSSNSTTTLPHKTYSGKFGYNNGTATYSYIETPDGRIFDGKWQYKESLGSASFTSEGQYKNDVRCGKWVWTYKNGGKVDHTHIFNFDDNGDLHGEAIYNTPGKPKLCYKFYFDHGALTGKYSNVWDCINQGYFTLEIDENGYLVGTAVYKKSSTSMIYYQNGETNEMYSINDQTGDRVSQRKNVLEDFERLVCKVLLSTPATWLKTFHVSPDRKGSSCFFEH